eukprot:gene2751-biopygen11655
MRAHRPHGITHSSHLTACGCVRGTSALNAVPSAAWKAHERLPRYLLSPEANTVRHVAAPVSADAVPAGSGGATTSSQQNISPSRWAWSGAQSLKMDLERCPVRQNGSGMAPSPSDWIWSGAQSRTMDLERCSVPQNRSGTEPDPGILNAAALHSDAAPLQSDAAPLQSDAAPLQSDAAPLQSDAAPLLSDAAPLQSGAALLQSGAVLRERGLDAEQPRQTARREEVVVPAHEHHPQRARRRPARSLRGTSKLHGRGVTPPRPPPRQ